MNDLSRLERDKECSILLNKLEIAKRKQNTHPERVTEIYLEIAEYLRNSLFMVEEATRNYSNAISFGKNFDVCANDCSLAYRNLAEMAIDKNDFDSAIEKISLSLDYAYKSNDVGLIQQALHQRAHICLSCELPEKALEYAKECRDYINEHSIAIDNLNKDGDSKCRTAHLQNLTAAIYMQLHSLDNSQQFEYDKKALDINELALKYANEKSDWTLYYRSLLIKLNLTIGIDRLKIAELLCNAASKIVPKNPEERRFKHESKCFNALEKMRHCDLADFSISKKLLWRCYEDIKKGTDCVSEDILENVKNALIFIYKTEQREKNANSLNVKDNAKRRYAQSLIFEKIADDATVLGMNEIALYFYSKMLKCSDSKENKRKALCSMAEAAKDCHLWSRALEFYQQVRIMENELGYSEKQLLESDIAIAIISAEVNSLSLKERLLKFKAVYTRCSAIPEYKRNLLPDYLKFLRCNPTICSKEEFDEKLHENNLLESEYNDHEKICEEKIVENSDINDEFDTMEEERIFYLLEKDIKAMDYQEKIIKERTNKNKHGESSLHEVARSDDYQRLKDLISKGYDVNQLDHGNWTPLSEAVSAQNMPNVRLLLMNGANPNTRSTEFLVDAEQNKTTSIGLTPLMEACSLGNIGIARILLQFKARASTKDDDDWTALEYLREFVYNAKGLLKNERDRIQKFADTLREKQMEEGFMPISYEKFMELLELKKFSTQKNSNNLQKFNSFEQSKQQCDRRISKSPTTSLEQSLLSESYSPPIRGAVIDIDSDDEQENKNEEESDEEMRNLKDYRKCISGLRNRRQSFNDSEFVTTTVDLLNARKRPSQEILKNKSGPSAKKLFFK